MRGRLGCCITSPISAKLRHGFAQVRAMSTRPGPSLTNIDRGIPKLRTALIPERGFGTPARQRRMWRSSRGTHPKITLVNPIPVQCGGDALHRHLMRPPRSVDPPGEIQPRWRLPAEKVPSAAPQRRGAQRQEECRHRALMALGASGRAALHTALTPGCSGLLAQHETRINNLPSLGRPRPMSGMFGPTSAEVGSKPVELPRIGRLPTGFGRNRANGSNPVSKSRTARPNLNHNCLVQHFGPDWPVLARLAPSSTEFGRSLPKFGQRLHKFDQTLCQTTTSFGRFGPSVGRNMIIVSQISAPNSAQIRSTRNWKIRPGSANVGPNRASCGGIGGAHETATKLNVRGQPPPQPLQCPTRTR